MGIIYLSANKYFFLFFFGVVSRSAEIGAHRGTNEIELRPMPRRPPRVSTFEPDEAAPRQYRRGIGAQTSGGKEISLEEWKDYNYRVEAPTRVEAEPDTPSSPRCGTCTSGGKNRQNAKGLYLHKRSRYFWPTTSGYRSRKQTTSLIYCCKEINPLADDPYTIAGKVAWARPGAYDCVSRSGLRFALLRCSGSAGVSLNGQRQSVHQAG